MKGGGIRGVNPPPPFKPCPPLSAIDKFLRGSNNSKSQENLKRKHTDALVAQSGFDDIYSSSFNDAIGYYEIGNSSASLDLDDMGFIDRIILHDTQISSCLDHDAEDVALSSENSNSRQRNKRTKCSAASSMLIKGQWTEEEDRKLIKLVKQYGERKWAVIAEKLAGRAGKQCRERWHNHLRPDIKKDEWSEEEEKLLIELHKKVGNKWAEIAKCIPGRTENAVKNHFNATKRRQNSRKKRAKPSPVATGESDERTSKSSLLQEYIKSTNPNHTSVVDTSLNQFNLHLPKPCDSISVVDPLLPLISQHAYDDEILFMENLFSNNNNYGHPLSSSFGLNPVEKERFRDDGHINIITSSCSPSENYSSSLLQREASFGVGGAHHYWDHCDIWSGNNSLAAIDNYLNHPYSSDLELVPSQQSSSYSTGKDCDLIEFVSSQFYQGLVCAKHGS